MANFNTITFGGITGVTIGALERQVQDELRAAQQLTHDALDLTRQAQGHWLSMYEAAAELQRREVHKSQKLSWRAYFCKLTGLKDDSRFRQLKRVASHARVIEQATGTLPTEWELRQFPIDTVPVTDAGRVVAVYEASKQVMAVISQATGKRKTAPSKSEYQVAQDVIQDMVEHQGVFLPQLPDKVFAVDMLIETHLLEQSGKRLDEIVRHSEWENVGRYAVTGVGLRRQPHPHIRQRLRVSLRNPGRIYIQTQKRKEEE